MAATTMKAELEALRKEVEELRNEQEQRRREALEAEKEAEEAQAVQQKEAQEKAEKIMERIEEGKADAKEVVGELLETMKKDYANLSPTSALILFALGAAFGHALASK